jgi:hypothetical protein
LGTFLGDFFPQIHPVTLTGIQAGKLIWGSSPFLLLYRRQHSCQRENELKSWGVLGALHDTAFGGALKRDRIMIYRFWREKKL